MLVWKECGEGRQFMAEGAALGASDLGFEDSCILQDMDCKYFGI
jgi:hypothetical protein